MPSLLLQQRLLLCLTTHVATTPIIHRDDSGYISHENLRKLLPPAKYSDAYIDQLIAEYARQREGQFKLQTFMDEFNNVGIIPMSLVYWQMTGSREMLDRAVR